MKPYILHYSETFEIGIHTQDLRSKLTASSLLQHSTSVLADVTVSTNTLEPTDDDFIFCATQITENIESSDDEMIFSLSDSDRSHLSPFR
jgi:hypothetical protein